MVTFKSFYSKPRSCLFVVLLLVFTACVYLLGNNRGQIKFKSPFTNKDSISETQLTIPESITLMMSSNTADHIPSPSNSKNNEPQRDHTDGLRDNDSVHEVQGTQHSVTGINTGDIEDKQAMSEQSKIHEKPLDTDFDPSTHTLVVIHIQKTGGSTFIRHLVTVQKNGNYLCTLSQEAKNDIENRKGQGLKHTKGLKRFDMTCLRDPLKPEMGQWLVSEKNRGWICGPHATLMEFEECLPHKNITGHLRFMINLRHPVLRYISEYLHFQRNASWAFKRYCDGKEVTEDEVPTCFPGFYNKKPWIDINLDKFLSCESNWANNRQTMALADLKVVGCYNKTLYTKKQRDQLILKSAKDNLRRLAFFGIIEFVEETCTLFEETFNLKFARKIIQKNVSELHSTPFLQELWNNTTLLDRILSVNRLDLELYEFGLQLFTERARKIGIDIDRDRVNKQIASLTPQDISKAMKRYRKLNYSLPAY